MNFTNNIFVVLVLLFSFNLLSKGQTCKDGYLVTPDIFVTYNKIEFFDQINNSEIYLQDYLNSGEQSCWEVISDRANNDLYFEMEGQKNGEYLEYMEKVTVKEVKGNWLHVFSPVYKKVGHIQNHKDRGWIHAKNMILSKYSTLNTKSSLKKAIILTSINLEGNKLREKITEDVLKNNFYSSPIIETENSIIKQAKKFEFFFVIKEFQGSVLLSKSDKLSASQEELRSQVYGWLPKTKITEWDHRVCLELNSSPQAFEDYKGYKIPSFAEEEYLINCIEEGNCDTNFFYKTETIKNSRPSPYKMRSPILENKSGSIKKVASIARLENDKKKEVDLADVKEKIQNIKSKLDKVNIVFVIDGTSSMKPYFNSVANSIEEIIETDRLLNSNNKFRFGIIIYRDYPDDPNHLEITPLTSNYNAVIEKLKTTNTFSSDKDLPEAQFNALVNGIPKVGFDKSQSNVIVLVGDAGNHRPDKYTIDDVVEKIVDYECSLISFQVNNGTDDSFKWFNFDSQLLISKSAKKYCGQPELVSLNNTQIKNTYKLIFSKENETLDDLFMFGRFTYQVKNERMDLQVFEQNIDESIYDYSIRVNRIKELLESFFDTKEASENGVYYKLYINYLRRKGLSEKEIQILIDAGDVSTRGYTSTHFFAKESPAYVPVVYLSASEKQEIDDRLKSLIKETNVANSRQKEAFQKALIKLCEELLGDYSSENINKKTLNEIWDIILGIPYSGNSYMAQKKLEDFIQLPDEKFREFYYPFKNKAEKFTSNDYSTSRFEQADQYFFWIPLNDLP